ncbi:hypothetical protein SAMN04488009_2659 [Maribacter sedimenticola]|uniref:Uncharacterized protein n=1 Tax=Maribacter sedimenticola TaxID=228956 RepID=A0ABY1SJ70_9FLAO|nr:hypothetical protein SAMN04488009_2659 [Maribacter sedimenticola]
MNSRFASMLITFTVINQSTIDFDSLLCFEWNLNLIWSKLSNSRPHTTSKTMIISITQLCDVSLKRSMIF